MTLHDMEHFKRNTTKDGPCNGSMVLYISSQRRTRLYTTRAVWITVHLSTKRRRRMSHLHLPRGSAVQVSFFPPFTHNTPSSSVKGYFQMEITYHVNYIWADHVNYTLRKAWKAHHFIMRILKNGNYNTKRLAYMALVRPILEYGAVCWDTYRGQVSA